ncbi:hypothetical protein GCM10010383_48360 [Streptomyces lomondensis]|uniref:Uncharacterized protein n=1 Tax=Streptomyces lomondensis TaxID=68229 RepID=A0ABQ2XE88_9ACTN|nr:hypothetical protein GCM10010383_48360 [Streptomyces lomondensis]
MVTSDPAPPPVGPGRPVVASYDEDVSPARSAVTRAVVVICGPVFVLAAAISRAAEGATVGTVRILLRTEPPDLPHGRGRRPCAEDRPVARVDSDMGDPSPQRIQHVRQGGEFACQVT